VLQQWVTSLQTGEPLGIVPLDNDVFGQKLRVDTVQRVVEWQRTKRRQGIAVSYCLSDIAHAASETVCCLTRHTQGEKALGS